MLYDYDYDLHQHAADYGGAKLRATQAVGGTGGQRQQLKTRLFTLHVPKHSSMAWIRGTSRQQGGGSATKQLHHSHTRVPTPRVFSPSLLSLNHHIARCSSQKHQAVVSRLVKILTPALAPPTSTISNNPLGAGGHSFSVGGPLPLFTKDTTTVIIKKPRTPKSFA